MDMPKKQIELIEPEIYKKNKEKKELKEIKKMSYPKPSATQGWTYKDNESDSLGMVVWIIIALVGIGIFLGMMKG